MSCSLLRISVEIFLLSYVTISICFFFFHSICDFYFIYTNHISLTYYVIVDAVMFSLHIKFLQLFKFNHFCRQILHLLCFSFSITTSTTITESSFFYFFPAPMFITLMFFLHPFYSTFSKLYVLNSFTKGSL